MNPRSVVISTTLLLLSFLFQQLQSQSTTVPEECLPPTPTNQVAPVAGPGKADIIFVLDTSNSMGAETDNIVANLNAFGQHLEDEGIDYRVVLVGQDRTGCTPNGCIICVNPPLAASNCAHTGTKFRQIDELILSVDACSRMAETNVYNQYISFLRKDAAKTIVFISDDGITNTEYDGSTNPGDYGCIIDSCKIEKATKWLNDIQQLDLINEQFKPTAKLSKGVMIHTIDGHNCPGEHGHQRSFVYRGLTQLTGGTNFKLCQNDWTPYFSTIASAVLDTTIQTKCMYDIPRSTTDSNLLVGNLEPNTPFTLTFTTSEAAAAATSSLIFTQSTTNTCVEQGCIYAADPCVCSARCPINYARDPNDATLCLRPSQPTCRLSQCFNKALNNGIPNCALDNTERVFVVNDPSDPRTATFCTHTCSVVRSFTQGGNISFAFNPVPKLRSMTVGGRGSIAAASFGAVRTLHPAHAFPTGHPAVARTDCGGAPSRPTIPEIGPALFSSGTCLPSSGVQMFYALDPTTGRSRTFQTGAGLMIFFLVNAVGESYLGVQIGHYASSNAAAPSSGYASIDVILSGATIDTMNPLPSWVVQDGMQISNPNAWSTAPNTKKSGRVQVSNLQGKTAGGILGPLPAYDFCVDVIIVEASGSVGSASIVNFDTATATPAQPTQIELSGSFLDEGGMRFCANKCTGETVIDTESDYSVTCYTNKQGVTYCPNRGDPDTNVATNGGGSGSSNGNNNGDGSSVPSPSANLNGSNVGNESTTERDSTLFILFGSLGLVTLCCIVFVIVAAKNKRKKQRDNDLEMADMNIKTGKKRQTLSTNTLCDSPWNLVIDPGTGDQYWYNKDTGVTQWEEPPAIVKALTKSRNSLNNDTTGSTEGTNNDTGYWYPFKTEGGHEAFANSLTGEVAWEVPFGEMEEGKENWVELQDEDGYSYYMNESTRECSWTNPLDLQTEEDAMFSNPMGNDQDNKYEKHLRSVTKMDLNI